MVQADLIHWGINMKVPFLGSLLEKVVEKGGDIIGKLVKDKDLAERLNHEFRIAVLDDESEIQKLAMESETRMFEAQQKTIQAELHQTDLFTKRTRPKIARRSFNAGLIYVLLSAIPENGINLYWVIIEPWTFRWEVLLILYSPALTYMGVRGFEKWKAGGAKL
jgi:hypothetical protein